uniref:Uncharacterized protein n=1 Tax=Ditylenchus dipsaci TaxID=166011 RepID=A0A915CZE9_9BILA
MIAVYLLEVQPFEWVVKADGLKIKVCGDLDIENVFCLETELPWEARSSPPLQLVDSSSLSKEEKDKCKEEELWDEEPNLPNMQCNVCQGEEANLFAGYRSGRQKTKHSKKVLCKDGCRSLDYDPQEVRSSYTIPDIKKQIKIEEVNVTDMLKPAVNSLLIAVVRQRIEIKALMEDVHHL